MAAFVFALGGSLHCVGMCGGLVMASTQDKRGVFFYQIGRLVSYATMAFALSLIGRQIYFLKPYLSFIGGLALGVFFLLWGIQTWRQIAIELPFPKFLGKGTQKIWGKVFLLPRNSHLKGFLTGLLSFLLPCGMLYALLFALLALDSFALMAVTLLAFWLGTLPAMLFSPGLIQQFIQPLRQSSPKILSVFFVGLGLATLGLRIYTSVQTGGVLCR